MILADIFNTTSILKHMHILQPFCIAVFLSLFRHNKTPKVFCLTFGVHVIEPRFFFLVSASCQADVVEERREGADSCNHVSVGSPFQRVDRHRAGLCICDAGL